MSNSRVFGKKANALKFIKPTQVLCNENLKKYFILDDYSQFIQLIQKTPEPCFYEFIQDSTPVNFFLDIEISKDHPVEFQNYDSLIVNIIDTIKDYFNSLGFIITKTIVLESHLENVKYSFHVIFRISSIYFSSVKTLRKISQSLFPELCKKHIIDTSVYREGLFRTYLSSKDGEQRPLIRSTISDDFDAIETFVCYCPVASDHKLQFLDELIKNKEDTGINLVNKDLINKNNEIESTKPIQNELTSLDIDVIRKFVRRSYKYRNRDIREILINRELNCINVNLYDTFCFNKDREHQSNHQYIVIDSYSSKQKCHDSECKEYKHNEIKISQFPPELSQIILKCLVVNKREQELIERTLQECKDYIIKNFDENIDEIEFDKNEMVFRGNASNSNLIALRGKCTNCKLEHHITNSGYCLKCSVCDSIYPKAQLIPVDDRYKNLNNFWANYSQLVNNGTIINNYINNYYGGGEEDFTCDIELDNSIFRNRELTKLYNQILDGHKVVLLSELMSKVEVDFKYTNGQWYFFNRIIWKEDKESLEFRKRIIKLSNQFARIQNYYEQRAAGNTTNGNLIKNIKSLVNKLHKTGFEDEIIKGAKMYYNDETFIRNLNSKKHLVPFANGVFDLLVNRFRKTTKEDCINLTVNFDYDTDVNNPEVHDFINKILPNQGVRDYVLKKMSECLNGDIPNTNFLMFIGDGANGKSQLLNLMKLVMGELGEKVEVTLLTRKRNNANEANTEKIKLMNKRFAFLSEPEDGEKINIGLLKELTGSEEIVARGLYQESVSFVMEAKLFLACNELPEIKGEDSALWRRIRVIDFPSRFVDEPKDASEFKIDRTLPSRMREDISWRQTFMNILLDYYYRDIKEPIEVQLKTNEYREENNVIFKWVYDNISYSKGDKLALKDLCQLFFENKTKIGVKEKSKLKKEIEKIFKTLFPEIINECQRTTIDGEPFQGWINLKLND